MPGAHQRLIDNVGFLQACNAGVARARGPFVVLLNNDTIVIALVEEVVGIRNLDAIIATEGVDVVGLGSGDLSHSMGLIGQKDHPDVVKAVLDAEHRIAQSGKVFDSVVYSLDEARDCVNRGSLMVSFAVRGVLRNTLSGFLKELSGEMQPATR